MQKVPCWISWCLLALAGCGGDAATGKVVGRVTWEGVALEEGSVNFRPLDGKTTTAGAKIANGQFTAVVPVGQMRVEISAPKVVGKKKAYDAPNSPYIDLFAELIPPNYNTNSTLTLDVKPGDNPVTYDLKKK